MKKRVAGYARTCLKKQSRNLHAPLCGIFQPNSVAVAYYGALIRAKSPTNCDTHLAESFFKQALRFICASGSTGGGGIVSSKNNVWESTWKSIPEIYVPNFTVYFAECLLVICVFGLLRLQQSPLRCIKIMQSHDLVTRFSGFLWTLFIKNTSRNVTSEQ